MNHLTVTCDDCGLSEGINVAALDLYRRGMANSASVLVNFPAAGHALELFRGAPGLAVGVHLNLTEGRPLIAIPAAAGLTLPDGRFRSMAALALHSLRPSALTLSYIEAELAAQFALLARAGIAIEHVTTHLQFHALPSLRRIVLRLAEQYRVRWVRTHRLRATVVPWNPLLSRTLGDGPFSAGPSAAPDYMAVLRNWQGRKPEALAAALAHLTGSVELVVHPDIAADPTFPPHTSYGAQGRFAETQFLARLWPLLPPPSRAA